MKAKELTNSVVRAMVAAMRDGDRKAFSADASDIIPGLIASCYAPK